MGQNTLKRMWTNKAESTVHSTVYKLHAYWLIHSLGYLHTERTCTVYLLAGETMSGNHVPASKADSRCCISTWVPRKQQTIVYIVIYKVFEINTTRPKMNSLDTTCMFVPILDSTVYVNFFVLLYWTFISWLYKGDSPSIFSNAAGIDRLYRNYCVFSNTNHPWIGTIVTNKL